MLDELEMRKQKLKDRIASLNLEREEVGKSMDSAEKSLQEIVGCTDWDTTRFFIEEDRNAHKEPEAIIQKQKADRQEVDLSKPEMPAKKKHANQKHVRWDRQCNSPI